MPSCYATTHRGGPSTIILIILFPESAGCDRRLSARGPSHQSRHPLRGRERQHFEPLRCRVRRIFSHARPPDWLCRCAIPAQRRRCPRGRAARALVDCLKIPCNRQCRRIGRRVVPVRQNDDRRRVSRLRTMTLRNPLVSPECHRVSPVMRQPKPYPRLGRRSAWRLGTRGAGIPAAEAGHRKGRPPISQGHRWMNKCRRRRALRWSDSGPCASMTPLERCIHMRGARPSKCLLRTLSSPACRAAEKCGGAGTMQSSSPKHGRR